MQLCKEIHRSMSSTRRNLICPLPGRRLCLLRQMQAIKLLIRPTNIDIRYSHRQKRLDILHNMSLNKATSRQCSNGRSAPLGGYNGSSTPTNHHCGMKDSGSFQWLGWRCSRLGMMKRFVPSVRCRLPYESRSSTPDSPPQRAGKRRSILE